MDKNKQCNEFTFEVEILGFYRSCVDVLSIPYLDINVLSITHVDKLSILHKYRNLLSIWGIDNLYSCVREKTVMSILFYTKIILVYTWYRQCFYISYRQIVYTSYGKMLYAYNIYIVCLYVA